MDVKIKVPETCPNLSGAVHHLPCIVGHNGPAPVSDYFLSTVREDAMGDPSHSTASFRGRPLNGTQVSVGPPYQGLVIKEIAQSPVSEVLSSNSSQKNCPLEWTVAGTFDTASYWNWDKKPCEDDGLPSVMQWTRLASAARESVRDLMESQPAFVDSDVEE